MAQFFWNGAVADWETANWTDAGGSPLTGVPQDGDTINISDGGAPANRGVFAIDAGASP